MFDIEANITNAVIFGCVIGMLLMGFAVDWKRRAPERKLDRLVRRSKGRW